MGLVDEVKGALSYLYLIALRCDQKTRSRVKLPVPVISVGNLAMGGRAKTPMVIEICRKLKEKNLRPVVLTRGYGRKHKDSFWILPQDEKLQFFNLKTQLFINTDSDIVDHSGDEALEIALAARIPVLIGANRTKNAKLYLNDQTQDTDRMVFVLDDGFQHWSLERNFDLVIVSEEDYKSSLVPKGNLREDVSSLKRADLVLELDKDIFKVSQLPKTLEDRKNSLTSWALLSGRAPDNTYEKTLSRLMNSAPAHKIYLKDHASQSELLEGLNSLPPKQCVLIGYKEAVKFFTVEELLRGVDHKTVSEGRELFIVSLQLNILNPDIWTKIEDKISSKTLEFGKKHQ